MELSVLFWIGICVAAVVVAAAMWLVYMGLFSHINVEVREIEEMTILNMNYTGSMQDCGKGCADFEVRAKELIPEITYFDRMGSAYYTEPGSCAKPEENKWSVFYVLNDKPDMFAKAKELEKSDSFSITTIPKGKAIYASFPYKSHLSFMLGPMKVYPAITKFMTEKQLKPVGCIEMYHFNQDPIEYIMYLDHKETFDDLQKTSYVAATKL